MFLLYRIRAPLSRMRGRMLRGMHAPVRTGVLDGPFVLQWGRVVEGADPYRKCASPFLSVNPRLAPHPPVNPASAGQLYRFSVRMIPTRLLISFVTSSTLFSPEKYADASSMMTL